MELRNLRFGEANHTKAYYLECMRVCDAGGPQPPALRPAPLVGPCVRAWVRGVTPGLLARKRRGSS